MEQSIILQHFFALSERFKRAEERLWSIQKAADIPADILSLSEDLVNFKAEFLDLKDLNPEEQLVQEFLPVLESAVLDITKKITDIGEHEKRENRLALRAEARGKRYRDSRELEELICRLESKIRERSGVDHELKRIDPLEPRKLESDFL